MNAGGSTENPVPVTSFSHGRLLASSGGHEGLGRPWLGFLVASHALFEKPPKLCDVKDLGRYETWALRTWFPGMSPRTLENGKKLVPSIMLEIGLKGKHSHETFTTPL